jgi:hypothetical protein
MSQPTAVSLCRGGGTFNMNISGHVNGSSRRTMPKKRKAMNLPRNPPAPKKQKLNNGNSVARPQRSAAAAYATGQHTGEPKVFRSGNDTCRIVHRELISSIAGTVAFTVAQAIALNPGLSASFPWLSTQAQAWERYRFNKLRYCYYTRTGSSIPGSVMLTPDYDAADAAPVSESIASSYQDCEEDAPWKDITCNLPQRSLMGDMKEKTIRTGALQPNQDIKTYDAGNMFVCTVDGTAVGWGKLWVEYDITLFHPQVPAGGFQASGTLTANSNITSTAFFGQLADQDATGPLNLSGVGVNVVVANPQIGQEIAATFMVVGTTITTVTVLPGAGLTIKTALSSAITATAASVTATFRVTASPCTIALGVNGTAALTQSNLIVTALSPVPSF